MLKLCIGVFTWSHDRHYHCHPLCHKEHAFAAVSTEAFPWRQVGVKQGVHLSKEAFYWNSDVTCCFDWMIDATTNNKSDPTIDTIWCQYINYGSHQKGHFIAHLESLNSPNQMKIWKEYFFMDLGIKILIFNLWQNILWIDPTFEISATSLLGWYVTFWLSFDLHILHWERAAIHVYTAPSCRCVIMLLIS